MNWPSTLKGVVVLHADRELIILTVNGVVVLHADQHLGHKAARQEAQEQGEVGHVATPARVQPEAERLCLGPALVHEEHSQPAQQLLKLRTTRWGLAGFSRIYRRQSNISSGWSLCFSTYNSNFPHC